MRFMRIRLLSNHKQSLTCTQNKGTNDLTDRVDLSKVEKQLKKFPKEIVVRLMRWIGTVEEFGLAEAKKVRGYHDEPLRGLRQGQRSVRLGIKWRAIYTQSKQGEVSIVMVEEVTPHDYRAK